MDEVTATLNHNITISANKLLSKRGGSHGERFNPQSTTSLTVHSIVQGLLTHQSNHHLPKQAVRIASPNLDHHTLAPEGNSVSVEVHELVVSEPAERLVCILGVHTLNQYL